MVAIQVTLVVLGLVLSLVGGIWSCVVIGRKGWLYVALLALLLALFPLAVALAWNWKENVAGGVLVALIAFLFAVAFLPSSALWRLRLHENAGWWPHLLSWVGFGLLILAALVPGGLSQ